MSFSVFVWLCIVHYILCKAQQFKSGSRGVNLRLGGVYCDPSETSSDLCVCVWLVCVSESMCMFIATDEPSGECVCACVSV